MNSFNTRLSVVLELLVIDLPEQSLLLRATAFLFAVSYHRLSAFLDCHCTTPSANAVAPFRICSLLRFFSATVYVCEKPPFLVCSTAFLTPLLIATFLYVLFQRTMFESTGQLEPRRSALDDLDAEDFEVELEKLEQARFSLCLQSVFSPLFLLRTSLARTLTSSTSCYSKNRNVVSG